MKNVQTQTAATSAGNENKVTTVADYVKEARKTNNSVSIELSAIEKALKLSRAETVAQARALTGDQILKIGRKGNTSVILTGDLAKQFIEARGNRENGNKHHSPRKQRTVAPKTEQFGFPTLRIHVGENQTVDIPLSMELVS